MWPSVKVERAIRSLHRNVQKRLERFAILIQSKTSPRLGVFKQVNDDQTWIANIRLLRAENQLIWLSERGTAAYVRCN